MQPDKKPAKRHQLHSNCWLAIDSLVGLTLVVATNSLNLFVRFVASQPASQPTATTETKTTTPMTEPAQWVSMQQLNVISLGLFT